MAQEHEQQQEQQLEYYTAEGLADRADVSGSWVAHLCREGQIPATKVGNVWIIQAQSADEWIRKREEHPSKRGRPRKQD